jgi:hypothetical protein
MAFPDLDHPDGFYRSDIVLPAVLKFLQNARKPHPDR